MKKPKNAFILRQSPSGESQLESISLPKNVIVNGWSAAKGLIGEKDYLAFREIVRKSCYPKEKSRRKAGYGAATMWRFLNEMAIGDWVVVPHWGSVFYIAEITGHSLYDASAAATKANSCYRRPVTWLNDKHPIKRRFARSKLISRMKTRQTSASAGDLIDEIYEALQLAKKGKKPSDSDQLFADQLRQGLVETALTEIRRGCGMDNDKFEQLVKKILVSKGATDAKIVSKAHDKGVDIFANFLVGLGAQVRIGVQVKRFTGVTENKWLDQLIKGMEREDLSLGWFVTLGEFEKNAQEYLENELEGSAMEVFLVDGELLAGMIIDNGLEELTVKGA